MPLSIIGQLKSDIIKSLSEHYIEFGAWLYIPKFKMLLSFDKQICQDIQVL